MLNKAQRHEDTEDAEVYLHTFNCMVVSGQVSAFTPPYSGEGPLVPTGEVTECTPFRGRSRWRRDR
jgi:hypothetical protein